MSRLDEIKARADAATEGPWVRDMHSPDMSGRSGWYIRGPRKLGLRSMVLNSRMLHGDAEFIEAAREDVPWLVERVRELSGAICWDTTCLNCSSLLDSNYDQYMRAEIAEAEVERLTAERDAAIERLERVIDQWRKTGRAVISEMNRAERAEAERDALAAQVARVEEVLEHWRTVDEGNAAYAERIGERSRFADGLASRADALRAALAGSGTDTSGQEADRG